MRYKHIFARLLLALQILQCFAAPTMLHATTIADAPELMDIDVPSSAVFKAIKKQWIRADLKEGKSKQTALSMSVQKLEKLAKQSQKKKKDSSRLKSTIIDFFADTSPEWATSTKFTKPRDWEDLQLFAGKTTLVESIDRSLLKCGTVYTGALLVARPPIAATLQRRDLIASLIDREDTAEEFRKLLQEFAEHEEHFFSNTMQPEDETVRLSIEDLQPGWLLRKLPKKLFSENTNFLRLHALLTQKTAPFLWTPLGKLKQTGLSFFGLPFPIWFPILWRLNGIPQTIFKDWIAYTTVNHHTDKSLQNTLTSIQTKGLSTGKITWEFTKFFWRNFKSYWFRHLFPYNKPRTALKAIAGIFNDLFLWNTVDLRRACAAPLPPREQTFMEKLQAPTPATAADTEPPIKIPAPPHLGDGRYISIYSNSQDDSYITRPLIGSALRTAYSIFFGAKVPDRNRKTPASFLDILRNLVVAQSDLALRNDDVPTTLRAPVKAVVTILKQETVANAAGEATKTAATIVKGVFNTFYNHTLGAAGNFFNKRRQAAEGGAAAVARAGTTETSFTESVDAALANLENGIEEGIKTVGQYGSSTARQFFADFIHYIETPGTSASPATRNRKIVLAIQLFSWVLISYLYDAWRTRNDEQKVKINILDKIMFAAVKPAMALLNTTSKIDEILQANKTSFPLPDSLITKIDAYKGFTQTMCKEFVQLAQRPSFRKNTGHTLLDHTGEVRRAYTLLQKPESKAVLKQAIHILAELDSYLGIAKLFKEYGEGDNRICPVDFINNDTPFINAKNAWFSLLGKSAIGSDITMGNGNATNMLLTGVNGGGKSIMLKTCVFSMVLAHVFGYTTAQQCSMTPFAELNLHLSSLDNAAEGKSRWVAEAEAIVSMINSAEDVHSDGYFVFISGDELGDGTAPDASIKVMIKLLSVISNRTNVLSFISSHLQPLTELEKTLTRLKNFRINPNRKLEPGINTTNIAFAVFEKFSNTKKKADGFAAALSQQTTQPHIAMIA